MTVYREPLSKPKKGEERMKTDVYSLYQRTKVIKHKDDEGREVEILLQKMTQRERADALEKYYEVIEAEKMRLREREEKSHFFNNILKNLPKEELTKGIVRFERLRREQVVDLYPSEEKDKKEKKKKESELLEAWEKERGETLGKKEHSELLKEMIDISIESSALIEAGRAFDNACLCYMSRDKENKKRIFAKPEDVEAVRDKRVLDWLMSELEKFRKFETEKEIRKVAEDGTFFKNGESEKK